MELISIREASRRLGVSDTAVHKAIASGRVTVEGRTQRSGRKLVGWPLAQEQWKANTNEAMRTHIGPDATVAVSVKPPVMAKQAKAIAAAKDPEKKPAPEPAPAVPRETIPTPEKPARVRPAEKEAEASPRGMPTYAESRAVREAYQARLAKLEFEEKSGKLVNADEVKAEAFKAGRTVRDALLNISGRIAHQLAHETDPARISTRIDAEIRGALKSLAGV